MKYPLFDYRFRSAWMTDIGRLRKTNMDEAVFCPDMGFFAVSDGMGGLSGGKLASEFVRTSLPELMPICMNEYEEERDAGKAAQSLSTLVQQMSDRLYEAGNTEGRFVYGATFCGVWLLGNQAAFINLGDSRAYLLARYKKKPLQITEDQNLAGMLVKNGMMTKEEAKGHPASSRLTAFVGMQSPATPDVFIREVHPGDRILLCSDGLYGMTEERELARIMRSSRSPDRICQRLIDSANAHGGCDNIAAVYLQITA